MSWRPHPKHAYVDPSSPRAWATSDRSGFIYNHNRLYWQHQWAGNILLNQRLLVGYDELDVPQEQLRSVVLPVDPESLFALRPEPYEMDETDWRSTQDGDIRITQDDEKRVTQPSQYEAEVESTG